MQAEPANPPAFNMSFMAEFVDELSSFDRRMNAAVVDSDILAHVPTNALAKQGSSSGIMLMVMVPILIASLVKSLSKHGSDPAFLTGRTIPLQKGAVSFMRRARLAGVQTHIVSVSWSSKLVRGALRGRIGVAHS